MSHTIYAGKISKRKNSTLQPTLTASFDVLLKTPTSLHTPTFTISAATFDYNYLKWNDRYYFVTDVVSRNNSLWEVSAVCDVLATFKTEILASTQFVCYSSHKTSNWLADTRIPVLKNATVAQNVTTMNFLFTDGGFYVLTAVGVDGCVSYVMDKTQLTALLADIGQWAVDGITASSAPIGTNHAPVTYSGSASSIEAALETGFDAIADTFSDAMYYWSVGMDKIGQAIVNTGFLGNAYSDAPGCIRSCIWVPFFASSFMEGSSGPVTLGAYTCTSAGNIFHCKATPVTNTVSVSIPWQFNDWRRAVCESVYLYLPMVGLVAIPSDEIINESTITVEWSATATDGCIAYRVSAGNQVIGTYGANASVNYPIGVSQQASAGEIVQSVMSSAPKVVAGAVLGNVGGALATAAMSAYEIADTAMSKHNSCIGGIGGGAGVGLSLDLKCFTVAHDTVATPTAMVATMGAPTMQPMALSGLTGYCQCANAHVAAAAESQEIDEIDTYLNSGFYIE